MMENWAILNPEKGVDGANLVCLTSRSLESGLRKGISLERLWYLVCRDIEGVGHLLKRPKLRALALVFG